MNLLIFTAFVGLAAANTVPATRWEASCGVSKYEDAGVKPNTSRIVGGWEARKGEWPWQVSMGASPTTHYCGAVIMNSGWILTAGHCADGEAPEQVFLRVGLHDMTNEDEFVVVHTVTAIFMHENYDDYSLVNDIALLKLTSNITFNDNVQPACPPTAGYNYTGALAPTSGWGSTGPGQPPDILMTTNLNIVSNPVCEEAMLAEQPDWFVTDDMICAGLFPYDESDSCQGDSGGPLVTQNGDSTWSVLGLTSWGIGCAEGLAGVYSRVAYQLDWIDGILAANP